MLRGLSFWRLAFIRSSFAAFISGTKTTTAPLCGAVVRVSQLHSVPALASGALIVRLVDVLFLVLCAIGLLLLLLLHLLRAALLLASRFLAAAIASPGELAARIADLLRRGCSSAAFPVGAGEI